MRVCCCFSVYLYSAWHSVHLILKGEDLCLLCFTYTDTLNSKKTGLWVNYPTDGSISKTIRGQQGIQTVMHSVGWCVSQLVGQSVSPFVSQSMAGSVIVLVSRV